MAAVCQEDGSDHWSVSSLSPLPGRTICRWISRKVSNKQTYRDVNRLKRKTKRRRGTLFSPFPSLNNSIATFVLIDHSITIIDARRWPSYPLLLLLLISDDTYRLLIATLLSLFAVTVSSSSVFSISTERYAFFSLPSPPFALSTLLTGWSHHLLSSRRSRSVLHHWDERAPCAPADVIDQRARRQCTRLAGPLPIVSSTGALLLFPSISITSLTAQF